LTGRVGSGREDRGGWVVVVVIVVVVVVVVIEREKGRERELGWVESGQHQLVVAIASLSLGERKGERGGLSSLGERKREVVVVVVVIVVVVVVVVVVERQRE
jgi:t-SNARE complex subunit (syntaxin)